MLNPNLQQRWAQNLGLSRFYSPYADDYNFLSQANRQVGDFYFHPEAHGGITVCVAVHDPAYGLMPLKFEVNLSDPEETIQKINSYHHLNLRLPKPYHDLIISDQNQINDFVMNTGRANTAMLCRVNGKLGVAYKDNFGITAGFKHDPQVILQALTQMQPQNFIRNPPIIYDQRVDTSPRQRNHQQPWSQGHSEVRPQHAKQPLPKEAPSSKIQYSKRLEFLKFRQPNKQSRDLIIATGTPELQNNGDMCHGRSAWVLNQLTRTPVVSMHQRRGDISVLSDEEAQYRNKIGDGSTIYITGHGSQEVSSQSGQYDSITKLKAEVRDYVDIICQSATIKGQIQQGRRPNVNVMLYSCHGAFHTGETMVWELHKRGINAKVFTGSDTMPRLSFKDLKKESIDFHPSNPQKPVVVYKWSGQKVVSRELAPNEKTNITSKGLDYKRPKQRLKNRLANKIMRAFKSQKQTQETSEPSSPQKHRPN